MENRDKTGKNTQFSGTLKAIVSNLFLIGKNTAILPC